MTRRMRNPWIKDNRGKRAAAQQPVRTLDSPNTKPISTPRMPRRRSCLPGRRSQVCRRAFRAAGPSQWVAQAVNTSSSPRKPQRSAQKKRGKRHPKITSHHQSRRTNSFDCRSYRMILQRHTHTRAKGSCIPPLTAPHNPLFRRRSLGAGRSRRPSAPAVASSRGEPILRNQADLRAPWHAGVCGWQARSKDAHRFT